MVVKSNAMCEACSFFLGEDHITLPDKKGTVSTGDAMAVVWYRLHNQSTLREAQNVLGYDESKLSSILKQAFFRISGFFARLERPRWITDGRRDFTVLHLPSTTYLNPL